MNIGKCTSSRKELEKHEKKCGSRLVKCPDGDCQELATLDNLLQHLSEKTRPKTETMSRGAGFATKWDTSCARDAGDLSWITHLCKHEGNLFLAKMARSEGQFHIWLYIAADAEAADKYQVEFHQFHKFLINNSANFLLAPLQGILSLLAQ
jgi:hypothetical protein